jgi:hypothetical protein
MEWNLVAPGTALPFRCGPALYTTNFGDVVEDFGQGEK